MSVTATNLIAGPATLYAAVFGATEPLDSTINDVPAVAWVPVGATNDGVTLNISRDYYQMEIDQVNMAPESRITKVEFTVKTNLAEATLENMALVLAELAAAVVVDGVAFTKSLEPTFGDSAASPNYSAILLDGWAPNGKRRRVIGRKMLSTEELESAYKKDGMTLVPVTFMGHWISTSIRPLRIVDDTSV